MLETFTILPILITSKTFTLLKFHKTNNVTVITADKLFNMVGSEGPRFPVIFWRICLPCSAFISCNDSAFHISTL